MFNRRQGFIDILTLILLGAVSIGGSFLYTQYLKQGQQVKQLENLISPLGASFTSTTLSDTINTFRTNVNTGLTNINSQLESVSSTIATYGTIVTANSPLPVANGGTATTTTPSNNQFLSNVSGVPTWKAFFAGSGMTITQGATSTSFETQGIDTSQNFSWTGQHTFGATTTINSSIIFTGNFVSSSIGFSKFGGTGADGALNITSGTTTLDLNQQKLLVKNYTSISITGGALAFTGVPSSGAIIILKSRGACTLTSAVNPLIELRDVGGAQGNRGVGNAGTTNSSSGGGGASASANGTAGTAGNSAAGTNGTNGFGFGGWILGTAQSGGGGGIDNTAGTAGTSPLFVASSTSYIKTLVMPGSGGGGGEAAQEGAAGHGGRGGGALWMECLGALNFTGTINASGRAGDNATSGGSGNPDGAGGGGGGGGSVVIIPTSITANSGTITTNGGSGGTGAVDGNAGGAGANGYSNVIINTEF